jgi:4-diphosphocytidyl-2-C-methyl-D-erythritol kinase
MNAAAGRGAALRWWPAPAKLNLFLHVVARRADGYHDLQTLFQLLDWGDDIAIEVTDDPQVERIEGPAAIPAEQDLVVLAARALQAASGVRRGARIRLRKRIPAGGGLGGGSSDAATVLLVLNRLWALGWTVPALAELGLTLGADVPVFVHGSSAWAEGRGERLTPLELPEAWYLIIHPRVAVTTADIFQAPELTRNSPLITIRAFSAAGTRNDCERVVCRRHPEIAAALAWLAAHGGAAGRLTGTGSCVFAACESAAQAERLAARVPDRWMSFVARGLNISPLHERLSNGRRG